MTIEMQRKDSPYIYRLNPDTPQVIDRRPNKRGARWQPFRLLPSATEAKIALLKLTRHDQKGS